MHPQYYEDSEFNLIGTAMKQKRLEIWLRPPIYEACLKGSDKFSVSVQVFIFHALEHFFGVKSSEHPYDARNLLYVQRSQTKERRRARIREAIRQGIDPYAPSREVAAIEKAKELLRKHGKL